MAIFLRPRTTYPHLTHRIRVYTVYSFTQEREWEKGELKQSEGDKDQDTELTTKKAKNDLEENHNNFIRVTTNTVGRYIEKNHNTSL